MELLVQDLAAGLLSMTQMAQLWQTNDELVYVCVCVCVLGSAEEEGQSGQLSDDMGAWGASKRLAGAIIVRGNMQVAIW